MRVLSHLVATDSVNPSLAPGAPGEREVADVTARHMSEAGLTVERYEPEPGRPSVVGRLSGAGGGATLMLNAHFDTLPMQMER